MHNLATINGRVSMAYQGQTPWHKLGTRMNGTTDVQAAMTAANLDWRVALQPMYYSSADGTRVEVDDRKAVIRDTDTRYLGSVGSDYAPLQNIDAFAPLVDACQDHGCTIESAGALGQGDRVWMLAKLPNVITPIPGDDIRGYFLIANGHSGKLSYSIRPTPIRVVCQNTLNMATEGSSLWTLRHTTTIEARAKVVRAMVARLMTAMVETGETFTKLASRRMSPLEIANYIDAVLPADQKDGKHSDTLKARKATIANLVWNGKGAELAGSTQNDSTAWAVYNAVAEYVDHVRPAEAKSTAGALRANESALFGGNAALKLLALQRARQLVAA